MYKGLLQQPTFIYTECSDVTEVFVTQSKQKSDDVTMARKEAKPHFCMTPPYEAERHTGTQTPPRISSSRTSIIKRPSSALMRYSSMSDPEKCDRKGSVGPKSAVAAKSHVKFLSTEDVEATCEPYASFSLGRRIKLMREISMARKLRERKKTDNEFLQFAKEFARKCRLRPNNSLLNPSQYDKYLHKFTPPDRLRENACPHISPSIGAVHPRLPSICSSSLLGSNTEDNPDVAGHVVGDLLSFTANTVRYFDNPDLSDVILVVGEHRFYSHKFALAAQSDVFRDMLIVSDRCTSCPDFQKELELDESKECQDVFMNFLRFFYCGKITFSSETALPLLVLSAKYRVEALRVACDSFITGMIEDGDLKSAVRWLRYAALYQLHDLTSKCVDGAISDNIEELVETAEWLNLSVDCVEAVLRSSSLLVPHEFFLFEGLQRWLMNKRKTVEDDSELSNHLRQTLQHIRFSQMNGTQLLAVEESTIGLHHRSIVRAFLGDAYRYQILAKESPEFQEPQYLPRDYTEKQWCVQLFYNPNRNKRTIPSAFYGNGRWEIQPRRYYDTLNVVIILKKPLENDVKVYISILIYKRNGAIQMRLRRKACVLRAIDTTPRPAALAGGLASVATTPSNSPRSNSGSVAGVPAANATKDTHATNGHAPHPHRAPHGPANKLHGPHNGQEYYAIDNIISDNDFQMAMSHTGPTGLKLGVIIRTWGANIM